MVMNDLKTQQAPYGLHEMHNWWGPQGKQEIVDSIMHTCIIDKIGSYFMQYKTKIISL